jgi:hypothetical protein
MSTTPIAGSYFQALLDTPEPLTRVGPFDFTEANPYLDLSPDDPDYVSTKDIARDILSAHPSAMRSRKDEEAEYHSRGGNVFDIRLDQLKTLYSNNSQTTTHILNRKNRVKIDDMFKVAPTHAAYAVEGHFLDFLLLVPKRLGFDVLLPPSDTWQPSSWVFNLDLSRLAHSKRQLRIKHGALGFDPSNSVLFLGRHEGLDVWLGMVPETALESACGEKPAGYKVTGHTHLRRTHLRIVHTLLLWLCSAVNVQGIYCPEEDLYRVDLESDAPVWSFANNFECV